MKNNISELKILFKENPQEIDINTINEFLQLKIVFKELKVMLMENIYRNRGYVM